MLQEIVALLCVIAVVKCQDNCWECNKSDLAICRNSTRNCPSGEQCFVERSFTNTNEVRYSAGCRSDKVCQIMQALQGTGKRALTTCGQCCTGPLCQDSLCGLIPSVSTTSTCVSCALPVASLGACKTTQMCQDTQVCSAGIRMVNNLIRYSFGCEEKHICMAMVGNEIPGHPGRAAGFGISICDSCCVGDQCNREDCFTLKKNMTVGMFSP